ncbi:MULTISPECIES: universal stress protein [Sphingomonadaceae]|uniref:universal stress protein n=1 Tax=Sphingomonadales TaxID=204457 RepID=UPI0007702ADE|nr:universal stress protein [Sphingobium sp. TKS]AMK22982.1 UspA domain-containing protein [Sphingobium sp. TKS]MCF8706719.1 universal stress protein [Rhizorhapis sp. SPR117]
MIKQILAIVETGVLEEQFLTDAVRLARLHDAGLIVVALSAVAMPSGDLSVGSAVVRDELIAAIEAKGAEVEKRAQREGFELRNIPRDAASLIGQIPVEARYADLALLAPTSAYGNPRLRRQLFEALVQASGRPLLVLPVAWVPAPFEGLLVGWNSTWEAARALADSLILAKPGAQVDVITVDAADTLKGHSTHSGTDVVRYIRRHGFVAHFQDISSDGRSDATALTDFAAAQRSDLLVLGAAIHSRVHELLLGGVTHDLLDGAKIPLLFSR